MATAAYTSTSAGTVQVEYDISSAIVSQVSEDEHALPASSGAHAVPVEVKVPAGTHTPGSPFSSRETETEYLAALADALDAAKVKLMTDLTAWKDAVGKFEDQGNKRATGGGGGEAEEEEDEEEEDEEEEPKA